MRDIVFLYKDITLGGVETLIDRMAIWFNDDNYNTLVLCYSIDQHMEELFKKNNIKFSVVSKWDVKDWIKNVNGINNVKYITFFFADFLELQIKLAHSKYTCELLYYCVLPNHVNLINNKNFIRKFANNRIANVVQKSLLNESVIFMDDDTCDYTQNFYKLPGSDAKKFICRLPIKFLQEINRNACYDSFEILAIARSEFPFKGYLFGLVDWFEKRKETKCNVTMTIISYGAEFQKLKKRIDAVEEAKKKKIRLINGVSPEKLESYYSVANIFVGMGTTVLEAANYGVPVMVVEPYTYELNANGLFHENPTNVGSNNGMIYNGEDILEQLVEMDINQQMEVSRCTRLKLKEFYDEDMIMNKISNLGGCSLDIVINRVDLMVSWIVLKIKRIKSLLELFILDYSR